MRDDPVAAVVLAAGTSSRLGHNKLFVELGGQSVLRRAVSAAAAAGLAPVLVVLGHEADRARAELRGLDCTVVLNESYASGLNASLRAGLAAVPQSAGAAVVLLADMPLVGAGLLRGLVERWRTSEAPLAVSAYGEVHAPPTLFGRSLFAELAEPEGEGCGRRVVQRHRGAAVEFAMPAWALADLDLPADVDRLRARLDQA